MRLVTRSGPVHFRSISLSDTESVKFEFRRGSYPQICYAFFSS
jgi:hypothetical protein